MTRLPALAGLLLFAAAATAQTPEPTPLPLADRPLTVADGSSLTLGAAAGPEGLVVLFWSTTCPWAERYADRVSEVVAGYVPAGVGVVVVTAGGAADARDVPAATRRRPAASALTVPYVVDADGSLAAAFGARNAPHAFFFGPDRTLVYDGAIDDSPADRDRVQVPYLQQALDQSIAGIPVEVMKTQAFGCTIGARP